MMKARRWFLLAAGLLLSLASAQPDGWRMVDRFHGFRFELHGAELDEQLLTAVQSVADEYACFGWTQLSPTRTIVGEARCSKARGKLMESKLASISNRVEKVEIMVYEDTKIRLHFSYFKILEPERDTCFIDSPHQCPEFGQQKGKKTGPSIGSEEL